MIEQLFVFNAELWKALSDDETLATYKVMQELGIAQNPYDKFAIQGPGSRALWPINAKTGEPYTSDELPDSFREDPPGVIAHFNFEGGKDERRVEIVRNKTFTGCYDNWGTVVAGLQKRGMQHLIAEETIRNHEVTENARIALIVLLATKNVVKTVTKNKLAKFGVGKARALYTTTLTIGKITEQELTPGAPTGRPMSPHLRRGHIRNQRYGPGFEYTRQIFIQPVLVNADQEFIATRRAYNMHSANPSLLVPASVGSHALDGEVAGGVAAP